MEFHQTLQKHSYVQGKYYLQKIKGLGPILLELFPFVILNGFCIDSFLHIIKPLMEFHQSLQTHSYLQDKY